MLMKLLHLLPPEDAHALTIKALQLGLAPELQNNSDLSLSLFGKIIRNPIGLSGGADKEAAALAGWSKMGFGIVEAGTVTMHARKGNPRPRMWRIKPARAVAPPASAMGTERMVHDYAVVNWLGLPGQGLPNFVKNLREFHNHPSRKNLCVGASIASPDNVLAEFEMLAESIQPYVDYITLNASCPNVADHSHRIEDTAAAHIQRVKQGAGRIPVLVKLGPTNHKESLERIVNAALAAGINGFVATNTVPYASRELLGNVNFEWPEAFKDGDGRPQKDSGSLRERSPAASERIKVGGYSGKRLLDISCWMVSEIRKLVPESMPIIGVGGVQSGNDAKRLMRSGANAIQLYTGLIYKGPALLNDIASALSE